MLYLSFIYIYLFVWWSDFYGIWQTAINSSENKLNFMNLFHSDKMNLNYTAVYIFTCTQSSLWYSSDFCPKIIISRVHLVLKKWFDHFTFFTKQGSRKSLELDHALKLTNRLLVETVITEGLLPFDYSHKTPACNKYIANIFAASFGRFAATRNFSSGIPTE